MGYTVTKHREFMYGLDVTESRVYHGIPSSYGHIHLESAHEPMESWGA